MHKIYLEFQEYLHLRLMSSWLPSPHIMHLCVTTTPPHTYTSCVIVWVHHLKDDGNNHNALNDYYNDSEASVHILVIFLNEICQHPPYIHGAENRSNPK